MDTLHREQWIARFLDWSQAQADVRAVVLVGSGSRQDHPADEWSDVDLLLISATPQTYLDSPAWLGTFGAPLFDIVERTARGEIWERRVLYAGGLDVDFMVLSPAGVRQNFPGLPVAEIMQRGRRVLLDKDGLFSAWPDAVPPRPAGQPPTPGAFREVVHDFWFHAVWTAKKLRRGELWVATACSNVHTKRLLLQMIAWHTQATQASYKDTWFEGRFIEQWAPPAVVSALSGVLAHYDREDVWRALSASMVLFQQLAQETAGRWQYEYPEVQVEQAMAWVRQCHQEQERP